MAPIQPVPPTVRLAAVPDIMAVASIHVRSWQSGYAGIMSPSLLAALSVEKRASFWKELLERHDESQVVLIAEQAGVVVGFVNAGPSRDDDVAGAAEVYALGVDPTHWGTGAGSALMSAAAVWLSHKGYRRLSLWVLEDNHRARRLYDSLGWMPDGTRHLRTFGDEALAELRYVLTT